MTSVKKARIRRSCFAVCDLLPVEIQELAEHIAATNALDKMSGKNPDAETDTCKIKSSILYAVTVTIKHKIVTGNIVSIELD